MRLETAVGVCTAICMKKSISGSLQHLNDTLLRSTIIKHRISKLTNSRYSQYLFKTLERFKLQSNSTKLFLESVGQVLNFEEGKKMLLRTLKRDMKSRNDAFKKIQRMTLEQLKVKNAEL
jgi:hypothetical protein